MTDEPGSRHSFLDELKRRQVVRVALVYLAVAFAVFQAADIMLPRLGLPDWTVTFVVVLGILGFPLALVLAWAFEMTPEGVRRTPVAGQAPGDERPLAAEDEAQPKAAAGSPRASAPAWLGARTLIVAAALFLTGIGLGAGWFLRPIVREDAAAERSVAVLHLPA